MKKVIVILSCSVLAIACGNSNSGKSADTKDTAASSSNTASSSGDASEKALEIIGGSDCKTCHKLREGDSEGTTIGPAYSKVAAKYAPAADTTIDRIVKKIISGGSGVWGSVPMTPHPLLKEEDIRTVVKYVMTIK